MKLTRNIAIVLAALAFGAVPAMATGHGKSSGAPGHNKTTTSTTTTSTGTTTTSKANAYGKACQAESKKHVAGTKGTPFSQCVVAMAQVAKSSSTSASAACTAAGLSHKKLAGSTLKGTPFSECVAAAAKLRGNS